MPEKSCRKWHLFKETIRKTVWNQMNCSRKSIQQIVVMILKDMCHIQALIYCIWKYFRFGRSILIDSDILYFCISLAIVTQSTQRIQFLFPFSRFLIEMFFCSTICRNRLFYLHDWKNGVIHAQESEIYLRRRFSASSHSTSKLPVETCTTRLHLLHSGTWPPERKYTKASFIFICNTIG